MDVRTRFEYDHFRRSLRLPAKDYAERGDLVSGKVDAKKLADDVLLFVNAYGYDADVFAEAISRGHRTLQQSVMRLFVAVIRKMAEVSPDDRNAVTVELAKRITEIADGYPLPFI